MKPDNPSVNKSRDAVRPELNDQFHAAVNKDDKAEKPGKDAAEKSGANTADIPVAENPEDGGSVSDF